MPEQRLEYIISARDQTATAARTAQGHLQQVAAAARAMGASTARSSQQSRQALQSFGAAAGMAGRQAQAFAAAVGRASTDAARHLGRAQQAAHSAAQSMGSLASSVARIGAVTAAGGGALAAAFGAMGVSSNKFKENTVASLTALLKSRQEAEKLYGFLSRFADVTPFDDEEVVAAGKALQTFGLDARRYLTLVGDAAAAMKVPLEQVVHALAKLKSGQFDISEMGPVGITREGLQKFGAKFKPSGEPEDRDVLFGAGTRLLQSQFGGTMAGAASGFDAQSSTMISNLRRVAAQATAALFESMKGAFAKTSEVLNNLLSDGRLVRALAVPFSLVGKALEAAAAQLPSFVAWIEKIASAENLITFFERAWALVRATTDALLRLAGIDLGKMLDPKNVVAGWEGLWQAIKKGADALFGMGRILSDLPELAKMGFHDLGELAKRFAEDLELAISRALLGAFEHLVALVKNIAGVIGRAFMEGIIPQLNGIIGTWNRMMGRIPGFRPEPLLKTPQQNDAERKARGQGPDFGSPEWFRQQRDALNQRQNNRPEFQSWLLGRAGALFKGQLGDVRGQRRFHEMLQQGRAEAAAFQGPGAPEAPAGPSFAPGHQFPHSRSPASVRRMYGPGQFPRGASIGPLVGATADMLEAAIKLAEQRIENFPQFGSRLKMMELRPLLMQLYQTQIRDAQTEKNPEERWKMLAGAEGTRGRIMELQAGMPLPQARSRDPFAPVRLPDGRVVSRASLLAQQGGQGAGAAGNTVTAGPNGSVNINLTVFPTNRDQILGTIEEALTRAGIR